MQRIKVLRKIGDLQDITKNQLVLLASLVVMFIVFPIFAPVFFSADNFLNVLRQASTLFMLAIGQTLAVLLGGIDLSQGTLVGFISVSVGMVDGSGGSVAGVLTGLAMGVASGLFIGTVFTKGKIPPFIVSLGMQFSYYGLNNLISGGNPVFGLSEGFLFLGTGSLLGIPLPVFFMLAMGGIMYIVLTRTEFGRGVFVTGDNEGAARLSGLPTDRIKISAWMLNGLLVGIGAIILTARAGSGQPTLGGAEILSQSIAATVIGGNDLNGGKGSVLGTMLGVLFISFLINGLNLMGFNQFVRQIAVGAAILIAIVRKRK